MPELPDVEIQKRRVAQGALQRTVERVDLDRGDRLLEGIGERALKRRLAGHVLASAARHGKYLFVGLDGGAGALVLHFGMTGFLQIYRDPEPGPEHPRLVLHLDDESHLAFDCQRLFGAIGYTEDPEEWVREHDLGPDVLDLDREGFVARLAGRRGAIKTALMDQSVFAGIGNVYSDEILFHARLHPRTSVQELDEVRLRELHRVTGEVLVRAVECRADPERMPSDWLLPQRDGDQVCPRCGAGLLKEKISQRSSWFCPICQPLV